MAHEERDARRAQAAQEIDPNTAEITWDYCLTLDPYGDYPDLQGELRQVGRENFARAPGSETWVWYGDLPEKTRDALRRLGKKDEDWDSLAFLFGADR